MLSSFTKVALLWSLFLSHVLLPPSMAFMPLSSSSSTRKHLLKLPYYHDSSPPRLLAVETTCATSTSGSTGSCFNAGRVCRHYQISSSLRSSFHLFDTCMSTTTTTTTLFAKDMLLPLIVTATTTVITVDTGDAPSFVQNHPVNVAIFVAGLFPFVWATWEFWRRIAVGASFGTGRDSIRIPSPSWMKSSSNSSDSVDTKSSTTLSSSSSPSSSSSSPSFSNETVDMDGDDKVENGALSSSSSQRRVLGKGALVTAYVLFTIAAGAMALTLYSVVTSAPLPASLTPTDITTESIRNSFF